MSGSAGLQTEEEEEERFLRPLGRFWPHVVAL